MTDNNIAPIFGGPVPGEIDPEIIKMAERFMARVRAGEVCAAAIVWVRPNGWPSQHIHHAPENVNALHSGVVCAAGHMTDILNASVAPAVLPSDGESA